MSALNVFDEDGAPEGLIASAASAESLLAELEATMDGLISIIEEETRLVRSGALMRAGDLTAEKSTMIAAYVRLRNKVARNRIGLATFAPDAVEQIRIRHDEFQSLLKINLAVLATAREVAEDIIRNVSESVGKASAPGTYGPRAVPRGAAHTGARGIAIDRNL